MSYRDPIPFVRIIHRVTIASIAFLGLSITSVNAINLNLSVIDDQCGYNNGEIQANVFNGTPPYTFLWSPAPPQGQGTNLITGLAGNSTYTCIVVDANMDSDTTTATVGDHPDLFYAYNYISQAGYHPCPGQCDGAISIPDTGYFHGFGPYTITASPGNLLFSDGNNWVFGNYCLNDYVTVQIQDANGCGAVTGATISGADISLPMDAFQVNGSCTGSSDGSVLLEVPTPPNGWPVDVEVRLQSGGIVYTEYGLFGPIDTLLINGLAPGNYIAERQPLASQLACGDMYMFTVPDLGPNCGVINGNLFVDVNGNCVQDPLEYGVPYQVLEITPGPTYAYTGANGEYSAAINYGTYDLDYNHQNLFPICPVIRPAPFTVSAGNPVVTLDLADSSDIELDLAAYLSSGPARPGFHMYYGAHARNNSPQVSGPVTMVLNHDPLLVPVALQGGTVTALGQITWNLPALGGFDQHIKQPSFTVPVGTPLGTMLNADLTVSNTISDANPSNDTRTRTQIVTGSYDPNDKLSDPAHQFIIDQDSTFVYTIRFQNTGTDTAFNVLITDTLSVDLDPFTFVPGAASHPYTVSMEGPGVVKFQFDNILLPDSNVNEPESHGFVSFDISPHYPVMPGDSIVNIANIYFDFNAPIITEPNVLIAAISTEVHGSDANAIAVFPNPVEDQLIVVADQAIDRIDLMHLDGRILLSQEKTGSNRADVNLSKVATGMYLVTVHVNASSHTTRVVKR